VFSVNLKEKVSNTVGRVEINALSIQEESVSAFSRPWSENNRFATVSREGQVEYRPRGTYLWNVVDIEVEVADLLRIPTSPARQLGRVYSREEVPLPFIEVEGSTPVKRKFKLVVDGNVVGDPVEADKFFESQGRDGTCLLVATATALESTGTTDADGNTITYERVYDDFTAVYVQDYAPDASGRLQPVGAPRLVKDANYKTGNGAPMYARIDRNYGVDGGLFRGRTWPTSVREYDYGGTQPTQQILPGLPESARAIGSGWGATGEIATFYGREAHSRYASDFTTLLADLEAGNPVIAIVDALELWEDPTVIEDIQTYLDSGHENLQSQAQHAVWITGVDISDPNNPVIIVNDSATGRSRRFSLTHFLSAWEDTEFGYMTISDDAEAPTPLQTIVQENEKRRYTLRTQMREAIYGSSSDTASNSLETLLREEWSATEDLSRFSPEDLVYMPRGSRNTILNELEKIKPGFKDRWKTWYENVENAQKTVEVDWGINLDNVKNVIDRVDFE
jgi:hypothetical protein